MLLIISKVGGPELLTSIIGDSDCKSVNSKQMGGISTVINCMTSVTRNFTTKVTLKEENVVGRKYFESQEM